MIPTEVQRIQFRHDTLGNWFTYNPILEVGEPAYETDTGKIKYGNGVDRWRDLPYAVGAAGPAGPTGAPGPAGPPGADGAVGPAGPQGPIGPDGHPNSLAVGTVTTGPTAAATITGTAPNQTVNFVFEKGPKGDTGLTGTQGIQGPAGPTGPAGAVGPAGPQGIQGPKGDAAGINLKGEASAWPPATNPVADDLWLMPYPLPAGTPAGYNPGDGAHYTGVSWINVGPIRGPQGPQGVAGPAGSTGPAGATGPAGPVGPEGQRGPTGPQGLQGPAGDPNILTVNATIPVIPSELPHVVVNGSSPNQSLDFYLPTPYIPTMTIGTVTEGSPASASITGSAPNFVLNLVIPAGGSAPPTGTTVFTINPQSASKIEGESVTFNAEATSTDGQIVYSWEKSTDGVAWTTIAGSGTNTLTLTSVTIAGDVGQYRCVATTASTQAKSVPATLQVSTKPPADGSSWEHHYVRSHGMTRFCNGNHYLLPYRSADGRNWELLSGIGSSAPENQQCLFGKGMYYTGYARSTDGTSFVPSNPDTYTWDGTQWISYVPFRGGEFMLTGYKQGTYRPGDPAPVTTYSAWKMANGIDYYPFTLTGAFIKTLKHYPGPVMWIGVGQVTESSDYEIMTSPTGAAWTSTGIRVKAASTPNQVDMCYTDDPAMPAKCVCVTAGDKCWTSADGLSWQARTMPAVADWSAVTFGNGLFMAVAENSKAVATSPDGVNWTMKLTLPEADKWRGLSFGNGFFLASSAFPTNTLDLNVARSG